MSSYFKKFLIGLFLTLATWGTYFTLLWPNLLFWKDGSIVAGNMNVWGDWAGHFSHASAFAYRSPDLWFKIHPLFIGKKEIYPFLADMISGLLIRINIDPVTAFVIPSVITTLLFLVAIYTLFFQNLKTNTKSFLATTIFLACGGLGFIFFFQDIQTNGLLNVLALPPREYTHISAAHIELINVAVSQLIPQRGLLLGMVMTMAGFIFLHYLTTTKKAVNNFLILGVGLLEGFLIITHVHCYLFLIIGGGFYFLLNKGKRKQITLFFISSMIISVPIYLNLYYGQIGKNFMQPYIGWMAKSQNVNWFYFCLMNWGIFLPLAIFGVIKYKYFKNPIVLASLTAFVLSNLMLFQPYDWDNTKMLIWAFLGLSIPVVEVLSNLWKKSLFTKPLAIIFFIILTLSGFLDLYRLTKTNELQNIIFFKDDIKLAKDFRDISKPEDVVLTSDNHNHFIPTLTGRQMLLGFRGWIWTYGIDYSVVEAHEIEMFRGTSRAKKLLKDYKVKYVVIDNSAKENFGADEGFFQKNYKLVLSNSSNRIYKIN